MESADTPVLDRRGKVKAIIHQVADVTRERRVVAALRASEERLRFLDRLAEATQPLSNAKRIMAMRLSAAHLRPVKSEEASAPSTTP